MQPGELQVAFGHVIRELRERAGLSQEELSFRCGRHRTYVSLIERGRNSPTVSTLWMLADALGVRPAEIIASVQERLGAPA